VSRGRLCGQGSPLFLFASRGNDLRGNRHACDSVSVAMNWETVLATTGISLQRTRKRRNFAYHSLILVVGLKSPIYLTKTMLSRDSGSVWQPGFLMDEGPAALVDPRPATLGIAPPLNSAHIDPVSKRLAGLVVRAQTKNIAVWVFDVHFS
jgi:hypothetical protein